MKKILIYSLFLCILFSGFAIASPTPNTNNTIPYLDPAIFTTVSALNPTDQESKQYVCIETLTKIIMFTPNGSYPEYKFIQSGEFMKSINGTAWIGYYVTVFDKTSATVEHENVWMNQPFLYNDNYDHNSTLVRNVANTQFPDTVILKMWSNKDIYSDTTFSTVFFSPPLPPRQTLTQTLQQTLTQITPDFLITGLRVLPIGLALLAVLLVVRLVLRWKSSFNL